MGRGLAAACGRAWPCATIASWRSTSARRTRAIGAPCRCWCRALRREERNGPSTRSCHRRGEAAGEVALRYFRTGVTVERKADHSPVTVADREARAARRRRPARGLPRLRHPWRGVRRAERQPAGAGSSIRSTAPRASSAASRSSPRSSPWKRRAKSPPASSTRRRSTTCSTPSAVQGAFDKHGPLQVSSIDTSAALDAGLRGGRRVAHARVLASLRAAGRTLGRQRAYGDYFGYTFVARGQAEAMIDVDLKPWDLAALKVIIEEAGGGSPTSAAGRRRSAAARSPPTAWCTKKCDA